MTPTLINTVFEAIGAALAGRSAYLASGTRPAGVSVAMMAFSALWAGQCIVYYLSHGESWAAFFAGLRGTFLAAWCLYASKV